MALFVVCFAMDEAVRVLAVSVCIDCVPCSLDCDVLCSRLSCVDGMLTLHGIPAACEVTSSRRGGLM